MRTVAVLIALVLAVSGVYAVDMKISPQAAGMQETGTQDVQVCVTRSNGSPYVGLTLVVGPVCQDKNSDEACGPNEIGNADGIFSVEVKESLTGEDGCGVLTLKTDGAKGGRFVYHVNGWVGEAFLNSEPAMAYIPEFGIMASAAVLGLAGLYIYKKRE